MGDREFIGDAWMAYLQHEKIPFILRLRENQHVLRAGYAAMPISVIAQHLKVGDKMIVKPIFYSCGGRTVQKPA
jgi:hypothetical protein